MAEDYTDLLTQQAALARRQKLLDALQGSNQAMPIQANNWTERIVQAIAKLGGGALAGQQQERLAADTATHNQQYSTALTGAMTNYMGKMQGTPETPAAILPGQSTGPMGPPSPAVPGDPRAAVIAALGSRFPEMQALGKEGLGALSKVDAPEKFGTPVAGMWQGKPAMVRHGDKGSVSPIDGFTPEAKAPTVIGGNAVDFTSAPGAPKILGNFADKFSEPYMIQGPSGPLQVKKNLGTGEVEVVDKTPKTTVNTHVGGPSIQMGAGQKAGYEAAFKKNADTVSEMGDKARTAAAQNSTLAQMNTLSDGGTYTGPTSQGALKLGQLASSLGMNVDQKTLTNSQTYNALATRVWQQAISAAGGNKGITAAEAEQLRTLSPELAQTPAGRKQITAVLKSINDRQIGDFRKANSSYNESLKNQDPTLFDLGPTMLPDTSQVPIVPAATRTPPAGWSVVKQ